jgi:hypothetical protein
VNLNGSIWCTFFSSQGYFVLHVLICGEGLSLVRLFADDIAAVSFIARVWFFDGIMVGDIIDGDVIFSDSFGFNLSVVSFSGLGPWSNISSCNPKWKDVVLQIVKNRLMVFRLSIL